MNPAIEELVDKFEAQKLTRRQLVASLTALAAGAHAAAAAPVEQVSAPVRGANDVPVTGSFSGVGAFFSGNVSHLGAFEGMTNARTGDGVWTAANGDSLLVQTLAFNVGRPVPGTSRNAYTQELAITGGTGHFEGASGLLNVEGTIDQATDTYDAMVSGRLNQTNSKISANEAMVRRRFSELDDHNFGILDELFNRRYVLHLPPLAPMDLSATKDFYRVLYQAFPDLRHTIEEQISARDKVTTRWIARGTHQGPWMGVAPTGRSIEFTGINIYTVAGGRFVQSQVNWDLLGLMQQIGPIVIP